MRFLYLALILFFSAHSFAADWALEKNKDGIKVYTRDVAGSEIKEFKAFGSVKADRIAIARALTRVGDFQNWMPKIDKSKTIKKVSPTSLIAYYTVDMPWPIDNRDVVVDISLETNNKKGISIIRMTENLTAYNELSGFVRIKKLKGYWKLISKGNYTDIVYQLHSDPGGSLPTWVINMFIVDGPYDSIMALREKLE
jgi:hypothetical protein